MKIWLTTGCPQERNRKYNFTHQLSSSWVEFNMSGETSKREG